MKQHARTHTDIDAMLIGQKTVPKGCRVLNVSPQGMMLQCEPDGRLLTFRDADLVDVHLTVQHDGGRKKFAIPAIVNRVDIKSIDVVFQHPNPELLKLIEAYRISDAHMMEASIALSQQEASPKVSTLPNNSRGATATADKEITDSEQNGRRALYPVLLTVVLSTCIAVGAYLYTSGIDNRLSVLETITINQTNELAEIRSRIFSSSLQEGRYASLNARLQALTDAFGTLESKLDTVISGKPVSTDVAVSKISTDAAVTGGVETPISITPKTREIKSNKTIALASPPLAAGMIAEENFSANISESVPEHTLTAGDPKQQSKLPEAGNAIATSVTLDRAETQPANVIKTASATSDSTPDVNTSIESEVNKVAVASRPDAGPWIVNLLSSRRKQDTDRLAGIAADNGIPVVQNRAIVQGKEYWRLQITGFQNAKEAKNYAIPVKKKLGIKDVWIFRQKN